MYNQSKRVNRLDETFQVRLGRGVLILHQETGRLMMLDRVVNRDESLQSIGRTSYAGMQLQTGNFLWKDRTGWIEMVAAGSGTDLGNIDPSTNISWGAEEGDYYHITQTGTYNNVPTNVGYHEIEGYYYRNYVPNQDYDVGEVVYYKGVIYTVIQDIIAAPQDFPHENFHEVSTGGMYTDEQEVDVLASNYYRLCEFDKSSVVLFNISLNNDHVLQISISTSGELSVLTSSWQSIPYIDELHISEDNQRHFLIFKPSSDQIGLKVATNGFSLVTDALIEPFRPIPQDVGINVSSLISSVYHINRAEGSYRGGIHASSGMSLYIDKDGNPVKIDPITSDDGILVHKKYVNDEIAKQRTLVSLFDPNNIYGWVDSDLNVIPPTSPTNNGYFYLVSDNSKVKTTDVNTDKKWPGTNTANALEFVIATATGDVTGEFPGSSRAFLRKTADNTWYSCNYSSSTFDGTNTKVSLVVDAGKPPPANDYDEIYRYVAWPSYFADLWLPPNQTGVLSNDTIISTGIAFSAGPPAQGGWKLIRTGSESVAERVMVLQNFPSHGFVLGDQVYVSKGPLYAGTNAATALTFVCDAAEGDITSRFGTGTEVSLMKSADKTYRYTTTVASSSFAGGITTIVVNQQGVNPPDVCNQIYNKQVFWDKAQANSGSTLKMATAWPVSANHFYAVYYGIIPFENKNVHDYKTGTTYYLSTTVAGGVQDHIPVAPADVGMYVQPAYQIVEFVETLNNVGTFYVKVLDWQGYRITELQGASFIEIIGQTLAAGVGTNDFVYHNAPDGLWYKADASDENKKAEGMVGAIKAPPTGDAQIILSGLVDIGAHGYDIDKVYYLSSTVPGTGVNDKDPNAVFDQRIFYVMNATLIRVIDPFAGLEKKSISGITVDAAQPAALTEGQLWLNSDTGDFYVLTNNPAAGTPNTDNWQWVQVNI